MRWLWVLVCLASTLTAEVSPPDDVHHDRLLRGIRGTEVLLTLGPGHTKDTEVLACLHNPASNLRAKGFGHARHNGPDATAAPGDVACRRLTPGPLELMLWDMAQPGQFTARLRNHIDLSAEGGMVLWLDWRCESRLTERSLPCAP